VERIGNSRTGTDRQQTDDHTDGQLAYVERVVRAQLAWRSRRRDLDRRQAFVLQVATVSLSALITVLLGLRGVDPVRDWLADIALVLGALVTVLAAWAAFFSHRDLWLQRSDTVHQLMLLVLEIEFHRAGPPGREPDEVAAARFMAEYRRIADLDHEEWKRVRRAQPSTVQGD
jgi:hypothetical protein